MLLAGGDMFAWFRKIRRINIFGFELEFDHSAGDPPQVSKDNTATSTRKDRLVQPKVSEESPARLTVHGEVVDTIAKDLGIRIQNEEEAREFWRVNQIDTMLDWAGKGPPIFSIGRKKDVESCKPGDEASMTVEVQDRVGGKRGIKTIAFEILRRG
jgi:hypothetical protein